MTATAAPKFWTIENRTPRGWESMGSYKSRDAAIKATNKIADNAPGGNFRVTTGSRDKDGYTVHYVRSATV